MFALESGRAGYCLPTMFFLGRSAISNGVDSGHDAFNMLGRAIHSAAVQAIAAGNSLPYVLSTDAINYHVASVCSDTESNAARFNPRAPRRIDDRPSPSFRVRHEHIRKADRPEDRGGAVTH